jgi:hypothetical protein
MVVASFKCPGWKFIFMLLLFLDLSYPIHVYCGIGGNDFIDFWSLSRNSKTSRTWHFSYERQL